jgi:predicted phage tail protein
MTIMRPFVNINSTSRAALVEQRREAMAAIRLAMEALRETCPHGRDYIGDPARFDHDRSIYRRRIAALDELCNDLLDEALAIRNG